MLQNNIILIVFEKRKNKFFGSNFKSREQT